MVDDFGLFRDAVEAINFHNDAGYIPNKKGAVVKRQARWMAARNRLSPKEVASSKEICKIRAGFRALDAVYREKK